MHPFRSSLVRSVPMLIAVGLSGAACGGNGGSGHDRVPSPTHDYGRIAYGFVTQQSNGQLTQLVLHSDGHKAVLLLLKDGAVERAQTTRLVGDVIDSATIQVTEGQVNVDADGTFADNDVVPASGYVLLAGNEIASDHIDVGTLFKLNFDFRAVYNGPEDATELAPLLFPG